MRTRPSLLLESPVSPDNPHGEVDVLSDVIDTLRLSARMHGVFELGAPFALELPRHPEIDAQLLMVSRGTVAVTDGEGSVTASAGDLVLLSGAARLELSDRPGSRAPLIRLTECPSRSVRPLHAGGEGARTTVVCLRLVFSSPPPNRLLADLPRLLIVPGHATPALAAATSLFASEVTQPRAGSLALLGRMAEVLFIEVLRREGERKGCAQGSLKALADPQLARALGLMHESPGKAWTIASLGRAVGLSRSAFAVRFGAKVGEPPLAYLSRWRMTRAAHLLTQSDASVGVVAGQVGYKSEAAFNRAFARAIGQPPGAYRKAAGR